MTAARKLITIEEAREKILKGIETGKPLGLDPISDFETFSIFRDAYNAMATDLFARLAGDEKERVWDYISDNGLNEV